MVLLSLLSTRGRDMKARGWAFRRLGVALSALVISGSGLALYLSSVPPASAAGTTSFWLQTIDSCRQALDGATYILTGKGTSITASRSGTGRQSVSSASCPIQRGSCSSTSTGCVQFTGVPVPGTYTVHETVTPPGNSSNPEGYAACAGGSACRIESVTVNVASDGSIQATTTAIYPDGSTRIFPSSGTYAGSLADPVLFHLFGLAAPGVNTQCDGDSDADDHSTGSPGSHCRYGGSNGEAQEPSPCERAGYAFPWGTPPDRIVDPVTCQPFAATSASTTTTSTTTSSTSSTVSTSTSTAATSTSTTSCAGTTTQFTGTVSGSSVSQFYITGSSTLCAALTWTGSVALNLIVYTDGSGTTVLTSNTSGVSGESVTATVTPGNTYKIKVQPKSTSGSSAFVLTVTS